MPGKLAVVAAAGLCAGLASCGGGGTHTATGTLQLQTALTGLNAPVFLTSARDGSKRLFVVEQGGTIEVVAPSGATPATFLDISSRVVSGGEQGLLGLAFHPAYRTNGRFFVDYTRQPDGATVIAEYHR